MTSLWTLVGCLSRWDMGEELWIDGSFLTEKIDPKDADLVLILPENFESTASDEQWAILDWWDNGGNEPGIFFRCDTFSISKLPIGDPGYPFYLRAELYWKKFFGTSREGTPKGMGRILLPDGCV
jgi:Family of unknown function (DUF6932)